MNLPPRHCKKISVYLKSSMSFTFHMHDLAVGDMWERIKEVSTTLKSMDASFFVYFPDTKEIVAVEMAEEGFVCATDSLCQLSYIIYKERFESRNQNQAR